jgi:hypothetical protein
MVSPAADSYHELECSSLNISGRLCGKQPVAARAACEPHLMTGADKVRLSVTVFPGRQRYSASPPANP